MSRLEKIPHLKKNILQRVGSYQQHFTNIQQHFTNIQQQLAVLINNILQILEQIQCCLLFFFFLNKKYLLSSGMEYVEFLL